MVYLVNRGLLGRPRSLWSAAVIWVDRGQYGQPRSFWSTAVIWVVCGHFCLNGLNSLTCQFCQPRSFGSTAVIMVSRGHFGKHGQLVPTIVQLIPCVSAIVQLASGDGVNRPCNLQYTMVYNRLYVKNKTRQLPRLASW